MEKHFSPELLGRVFPVHFRTLDEEETFRVADLEVKKLTQKIRRLGLEMKIDSEVPEFLMRIADWQNYGCRNLRNVTTKSLGKVINDVAIRVLKDSYEKIKDEYGYTSPESALSFTIQEIHSRNIGLEVSVTDDSLEAHLYQHARG